MKRHLYQVAVISVLFIVVMFVVSGCGGKNAAVNQKGEIPVLTWLVPGDKEADIESVMKEVDKIIEPSIGAKLDLQFIDGGAYSERMMMNMASQTAYDLCFTGYVNTYAKAVENGGLEKLDKLIEDKAPGLKTLIPDYFWNDAKISGGIYAVPNVQVAFTQYTSYVEKALAQKYGFDFSNVKTMNELEPFLKKVKDGEPGIYPWNNGYGIGMWYGGTYEEIIQGFAIKLDGSSKKAVLIRDTPEFMNGLKTIRDWYLKGYIRKDVASVTDDTTDYLAGKYAVSQNGWKPGAEAQKKLQTGREVVAVKMMEPILKSSFSRQTMTGISVNSKNKEKAIKLIEQMNKNKELYNLVSFGIEGKHYKLNGDKRVEFIEKSGYAPKSAWKFGNQFLSQLIVVEDDNVWEETQKTNNEAKKSALLGFYFDTEPVMNEIAQIQAIYKEYGAMHMGNEDPKVYWDTMVSRLKAAGEDRVMAEVQKQLDVFFAKQ